MPEIALTGGIGSGKSTVARGLADRGALLIDADRIVRELQEPGQPVFEQMVERWGKKILAADGSLDREAVAAIVFSREPSGGSEKSRPIPDPGPDPAARPDRNPELEALNAIVHPAVGREMAARRAEVSKTMSAETMPTAATSLVVLEIPLLVSAGGKPLAIHDDLDGIVVVDVAPEIALQRLVQQRGLDESDARARIANQADRESRLAIADFVIDNGGSFSDLDRHIDACWEWVRSLDPRRGSSIDSSQAPS